MPTDADVVNPHAGAGPTVRLLEIARADGGDGSCGFHLRRGKWDPYPWIGRVDAVSPAHAAGMQPGDCLLQVNGEDIVGMSVSEVAHLVRARPRVALLLWNAGTDASCSPEALCCGPMPTNLQRLTACLTAIVAALECPVCLDTTLPPAYQCDNGHLICPRCRPKTDRCPVCRQRLDRARSLLADQVYNAIADSFELREETNEARLLKVQKIFKLKKKKKKNVPGITVTQAHTVKFLARLIGKSSSVDNLSTPNMNTSSLNMNSIFTANLKAKSLSSNEIFQSIDPAIVRSASVNIIDRENSNKLSYHRSYENLNEDTLKVTQKDIQEDTLEDTEDDTQEGAQEDPQENTNEIKQENPQKNKLEDTSNKMPPVVASVQNTCVSYFCPYLAKCTSVKIEGQSVLEHFQEEHDGPLVQFFKPKVTLSHLDFGGNDTFLISFDNNLFFLKIQSYSANGYKLWIWLVGNKMKSVQYQFQVTTSSTVTGTIFFTATSVVYSLQAISCSEINTSNHGIYINTEAMDDAGYLKFDIEILRV